VPVRRSLAYLTDLLLIAVLMGVAAVVFGLIGILSFGILSPVLWIIFGLIPLGYHTFLIGGPRSATLGMQLFGVEVRTLEGGRPEYLTAALQTILFYVTVSFTSWLILLVALFNRRGRCLHDWLCGTVVVRSLP
jgi:uncharacterized RDD family membrane protein YckC